MLHIKLRDFNPFMFVPVKVDRFGVHDFIFDAKQYHEIKYMSSRKIRNLQYYLCSKVSIFYAFNDILKSFSP